MEDAKTKFVCEGTDTEDGRMRIVVFIRGRCRKFVEVEEDGICHYQ